LIGGKRQERLVNGGAFRVTSVQLNHSSSTANEDKRQRRFLCSARGFGRRPSASSSISITLV